MVILCIGPDAFERDDPRGVKLDLSSWASTATAGKTIHSGRIQLHLSRFTNMAH